MTFDRPGRFLARRWSMALALVVSCVSWVAERPLSAAAPSGPPPIVSLVGKDVRLDFDGRDGSLRQIHDAAANHDHLDPASAPVG
ncbi:MAG: hypothetical protein NUV77_18150, partial [Thermoguttaceae bacterium]|nr:hypothetical protein [Thermoguttaceae bacterium]